MFFHKAVAGGKKSSSVSHWTVDFCCGRSTTWVWVFTPTGEFKQIVYFSAGLCPSTCRVQPDTSKICNSSNKTTESSAHHYHQCVAQNSVPVTHKGSEPQEFPSHCWEMSLPIIESHQRKAETSPRKMLFLKGWKIPHPNTITSVSPPQLSEQGPPNTSTVQTQEKGFGCMTLRWGAQGCWWVCREAARCPAAPRGDRPMCRARLGNCTAIPTAQHPAGTLGKTWSIIHCCKDNVISL